VSVVRQGIVNDVIPRRAYQDYSPGRDLRAPRDQQVVEDAEGRGRGARRRRGQATCARAARATANSIWMQCCTFNVDLAWYAIISQSSVLHYSITYVNQFFNKKLSKLSKVRDKIS